MSNKTWVGAAIFVLFLAGVMLPGWLLLDRDTGSRPVFAQEVMERAASVQTALLDSVGPDTTVHVVMTEYDPSRSDMQPGPNVYPVHVRHEWWAYFGPDGDLSRMRIETRDGDSDELLRVSEYADGRMKVTYSVYPGDTLDVAWTWSVDALRDRLIEATNITASEVAVAPDAPVRDGTLDGEDVYIVEAPGAGTVERTFIEQANFRPVKYEVADADTGDVVESGTMPVFEIVPGNQMPGA